MRTLKMLGLVAAVMVSLYLAATAGASDSDRAAGKDGIAEVRRPARPDRDKADRSEAGQQLRRLLRNRDRSFERKNSDEDLLRGFTTYSHPVAGRHVAYLLIRWGDLDKMIEGYGPQYYSNWDGFVKLSDGLATVAKKIAFDDGSRRRPRPESRNDDDGDDDQRHGEPGEGSGRDRIIPDNDPGMIVWQAGVVGGTDGLLIRLSMPRARGRIIIKAGNFRLVLPLRPKPQEEGDDDNDGDGGEQ